MGFGYGRRVVLSHGFKRERGVRKVFNNDMVAHVWAQQKQSEGQNAKGTLWFAGEWLYSYSTAIARIYTLESGASVMLTRDENFSNTTSGHMPSRTVFAGASFSVPYIGSCEGRTKERWGADWKTDNASVFVSRWNQRVDSALKSAPLQWQQRLEDLVTGYRWSDGERPANVAEAAQRYESEFVADLMTLRTQCVAYCDALGVDYPPSFASESESRANAESTVQTIVARFRRILDNPKNKARREASRVRRAATSEAFAKTMQAQRLAWLDKPDSDLLAAHDSRWHGGPKAPSVSYWTSVDGMTKAQVSAARELLRKMETENATASHIAAKEARLEFAANEQKREHERAAFEAWQRGEDRAGVPGSYRSDKQGSVYLRRVTRSDCDMIQTSQGAEVLFADAVRLFRFAKLIRQRYYPTAESGDNIRVLPTQMAHNIDSPVWRANGATLRVSHFQLTSVSADGSCRVGCHFLSWERIAEAAKACGVFELEPADTTESN